MVRRLKSLPPKVKGILRTASRIASSSRVNIYLVGGIVRDLILNRENFDYDIVIEGDAIMFAKAMALEYGVNFCKHHAFGTATVYFKNFKIDFATCRKEYYSFWGALPKVKPASLKDDLFRRDFTINAMAVSLNKENYGKLIDLYSGYHDLKKGLIRVIHDKSFLEDPTRLLRAIRFEQRFSFKIEPHTRNLLVNAAKLKALKFIDEQRIRDELMLILKERQPLKYIRRIDKLLGFSFINSKLKLKPTDYELLSRIQRLSKSLSEAIGRHRQLNTGLLYLMGIVGKLSQEDRIYFCRDFGLRKLEQKQIINLSRYKKRVSLLARGRVKKTTAYNLLKPFDIETLVFLYAYYKNKKLRNSIIYFLSHSSHLKTKLKGRDLKKLKFKPFRLYGKALHKLLLTKIEKGLTFKKDELKELRKIFAKLKKSYPDKDN